jgi:hypothetical protein
MVVFGFVAGSVMKAILIRTAHHSTAQISASAEFSVVLFVVSFVTKTSMAIFCLSQQRNEGRIIPYSITANYNGRKDSHCSRAKKGRKKLRPRSHLFVASSVTKIFTVVLF